MYGIPDDEGNFPDLSDKNNILKDCLTKDIYSKLCDKTTQTGYTLDEAIQIGIDCSEDEIGFIIGDNSSLETFEPLITKILTKYHQKNYKHDDSKGQRPNTSNFTIEDQKIQSLNGFVLSYSFQLRRNLSPYCLPAKMTRAERRETNVQLLHVLKKLVFDMDLPWGKNDKYGSSKYKPNMDSNNNSNNNNKKKSETKNDDMNNEIKKQKVLQQTMDESRVFDLENVTDYQISNLEDKYLYPNRYIIESKKYLVTGISRDFPDARSVFYNETFNFSAYTNHDNHLNIIIQNKGANLNYAYLKFIDIYRQLKRIMKSKDLKWIRDQKLGWVTTSLKHIGTGLTVDTCLNAPNLYNLYKKKTNIFHKILRKRELVLITESYKEPNKDTIWVQTTNCLGVTECDIVRQLVEKLLDLLKIEKKLKRGDSIKNLI